MTMNLTPYHAKLFAHDLLKKRPSGDVGKLAASLQDAQVDLNPHQVDAALFAFQSPLSKGAILADEVGLGKTIEAGIILSQKWAERKRKLLIIAPSNLRKQWSQELADKFFLPSLILESKSFNQEIEKSNFNPFNTGEHILICSFQFAKTKETYIRRVPWDLVVIDEAHRLRNVYKPRSYRGSAPLAPRCIPRASYLTGSTRNAYAIHPSICTFTRPCKGTPQAFASYCFIPDEK